MSGCNITARLDKNLGATFEELAQIIDGVDRDERMGVCLDTCHIFAAGYAITSADEYAATMRRFGDTVGIERLRVIHVNDSKMPFGSHRDRHDNIGQGYIGTEPFRRLLRDTRLANVPMVLETPKAGGGRPTGTDADPQDLDNLALLRRLRDE